MRKSLLLGLAALASATALATPAAAAELGSGFSINGGATIVTDYRFRGISQSYKNFAVQGTVSVSHESGFYATVWGSSIDDYVAGGADLELDLIGGFKHSFEGGPTIDVGVLYYYYPGGEDLIPGLNTDFVEPYASISHTIGPVTGKVLAAYAPKQSALSAVNPKDDNFYLALDLSAGIPDTGIGFTGHVGHTWGPSFISVGEEYTDWSLGVTYTTGPLTLGVSYVDTDEDVFVVSPNKTKNITKAGVVGSVGVAF